MLSGSSTLIGYAMLVCCTYCAAGRQINNMLRSDSEYSCNWEQSIRSCTSIRKSLNLGSHWMAGGAAGKAAIMSALVVCRVPVSDMVYP